MSSRAISTSSAESPRPAVAPGSAAYTEPPDRPRYRGSATRRAVSTTLRRVYSACRLAHELGRVACSTASRVHRKVGRAPPVDEHRVVGWTAPRRRPCASCLMGAWDSWSISWSNRRIVAGESGARLGRPRARAPEGFCSSRRPRQARHRFSLPLARATPLTRGALTRATITRRTDCGRGETRAGEVTTKAGARCSISSRECDVLRAAGIRRAPSRGPA